MVTQSSQSAATHARLASNLRRLRIAGHLSLSQLAQRTGVSKATLSGIEGARANPTIDTLTALAHALGVAVAQLLEEGPVGEIRIVRASTRERWPASDISLTRHLLDASNSFSGHTEVVELTLAAHHLHDCAVRAGGARLGVLVLKGRVIAGPSERISELVAGDYASFPADVPHQLETTRAPARVLCVAHTPG